MLGETPPDPLHFGGTPSGSSTGWTDEKHMLYIRSLELSFVTKLYDGEVNSNGSFCWSPSVWRHKTGDGNHRNTQVGQVFCGMVEADRAESRISQTEHTESPSCDGDQDGRKAYYMDDDASASDPRQEGVRYYTRRKNFGGSSTSCLHWHGHSLSGTGDQMVSTTLEIMT
uniref:Uncharacterized protein n=1 Tax=Avena sativa TaxID=4498 RepID=A0ACD5WXA6_AVESA